MKNVLIFADYFYPGFKAGGPINSIRSLCSALAADFNIYIITRDRDILDIQPYASIRSGGWCMFEGVNVLYIDERNLSLTRIYSILLDLKPSVVHMNSLMSVRFSFVPFLAAFKYSISYRHLHLVVSPRGELSHAALGIKALRKYCYRQVLKLFGYQRKVLWVASCDAEQADIIKAFGRGLKVFVIPNIPNGRSWQTFQPRAKPKVPSSLKMVFCSRISRIKSELHYRVA